MKNPLIITIGLLILTAASFGVYMTQKNIEENKFTQRDLLKVGTNNTTLWLYYDQSDVNSRNWSDFGSRSSRVLNTPYLNLCYQTIVMKNGSNYNVKVLAGLSDVALLLGGWNELPKSLQNPLATVGSAELNYIRARILRQFGGLWVNPSIIFLKSLPDITKSKSVIFFGTNKDETYNGTSSPSSDIMYSPEKENEIYIKLEEITLKRLTNYEGGKQFSNNDLKEISKTFDTITYMPSLEYSRKSNGRRIQLEDLLISKDTDVPNNVVYVPIDSKELTERQNFGWFLRMSENQILESDLLISSLFRMGLSN